MNCRILDLPFTQPPQKLHVEKASDNSNSIICFSYLPFFWPPPHQEPAACRPCGTVPPDASVLGLAAGTRGKWSQGAALERPWTDAYTVCTRKGQCFSFHCMILPKFSKLTKLYAYEVPGPKKNLFLLPFGSKIININKVTIVSMKAWVRRK